MSPFGFIELLMVVLTGGGGNDLLDYLPTDAYWKAKGVTVTVDTLVEQLTVAEPAELPTLIRDLGADEYAAREAATRKLRALGPVAADALKKAAEHDDPEVRTRARGLLKDMAAGTKAKAARRLMAIRTLGEMKTREALPALRRLLPSKGLFVADYARQAIAAIEGKPYQRPQPAEKALREDLALLPKNCGVVAQAAMPPGGPIAFDKVLQGAAQMIPGGQDKAKLLEQLTKGILMVAERIGNVRVDRVTLGLADNVGDDTGFVVLVVRGLYDAAAVKATLEQQLGLAATNVDGVDVHSIEREFKLMACSNERLVLVGGPRQQVMPVKEIVAALKAKAIRPALDRTMRALIESTDIAAPLWGVASISDAYRQAPIFAPFDDISLSSRRKEGAGLALTLVARGKDVVAVKAAATQFEGGVKMASAEVKKQAGRMPAMKPIVDFLDSIRIQTDGAKVTATATLKGTNAVLLMPVFLFMGRAVHMQVDKAVVEQEAIPQPPPPPPAPRPIAPR